MAVNRVESAKSGGEPAKTEAPPEPSANGAGQVNSAPKGLKPWVPLLMTVIAMPLLAYATTTFVLLPKLKKTLAGSSETSSEGSKAVEETPAPASGSASKEKGPGNGKVQASLSKNIMVNVSGSMGTR